jgi:hypothetical protein
MSAHLPGMRGLYGYGYNADTATVPLDREESRISAVSWPFLYGSRSVHVVWIAIWNRSYGHSIKYLDRLGRARECSSGHYGLQKNAYLHNRHGPSESRHPRSWSNPPSRGSSRLYDRQTKSPNGVNNVGLLATIRSQWVIIKAVGNAVC